MKKSNMSREARLTTGPVGKTLFSMTLPMLLGILAIITFNIVDAYFVGQLGTEALAAISFTFPVVMVLMNLSMGVGIGTSSAVARAIGEADSNKVKRLTTDGLILAVIIVGIFVVVGLFTIDPLFRLLGASDDLLPLIHDYMVPWYFGMIFIVVPMVGNSAIRATGNAMFPGIIMMISAGVNLLLDPIFIFGLFGFPRMELKGAAIATVVAWVITFCASMFVLHYKERMITTARCTVGHVCDSWKQILHVGIPAAFTNVIIPLATGVIMSMLATFGTETVAAYGVATRIEAFAIAIFMAMSSIAGPFVGQNWGAKKYDRVERGMLTCFVFAIIWGIMLTFILSMNSSFLVSLFDSDRQVIAVGFVYFLIVPVSYGAQGVSMFVSASFNGLGKPLPSTLLSFIRMFILYIPLAYAGKKYFGVVGIFAAGMIANFSIGIWAYLWHRRMMLKKIELS